MTQPSIAQMLPNTYEFTGGGPLDGDLWSVGIPVRLVIECPQGVYVIDSGHRHYVYQPESP